MLIPLNINLQDDYCKKCKFLYLNTVKNGFQYNSEMQELINYIESNPKLTQETIQYYKNLGIELQDLQFGEATAYTIAQLIVDLLNKIDPSGYYKFECIEHSKYCQSIGYTCFYD